MGDDAMPLTANLDIDLLRSFVAIAEARSFSRAAERLLRNQSTVSLQLKRLEAALDKRLFARTSRAVRLTPEGEAMLDSARRLLALNDEIVASMQAPQIEGAVRIGTPEDFATTHLQDVLASFARSYPRVSLEVTCDLTLTLAERYRAGQFDLVLLKQEPAKRAAGVRVWREPLVWVAAQRPAGGWSDVLPLALSPPPCVYRKRATDALRGAGRRWRIAYSCAALAGTLAAVRAGLGITVLPRGMVPSGLAVFDDGRELPDLSDTEIALLSHRALSPPARRLREHIIRSLEAGEAALGGAAAPASAAPKRGSLAPSAAL